MPTTYPCILTIKNLDPTGNNIFVSKPKTLENKDMGLIINQNFYSVSQNNLSVEAWSFQNEKQEEINIKIKKNGTRLQEYCSEKINRGLLTGLDRVFVIDNSKKNQLENKSINSSKLIFPYLIGKQIKRYSVDWSNTYILLIKKGQNIKKFPAILEYLIPFKKELESRWDKGEWYSLRTCAFYDDFNKPKIIFAHFATRPQFTFDDKGFHVNAKAYILPINDKYLLGILNSKVIAFFSRSICPFVRGKYYEFNKQYVNEFPIAITCNKIRDKIMNHVEKILYLNENFLKINKNFQESQELQNKLNLLIMK